MQNPAYHQLRRIHSASPDDLRKLILKLRWIGHDSEAEELCAELGRTAEDVVCVDELRVTD